VVLTAGQAGDAPQFEALLGAAAARAAVGCVVADKAYDSDKIRTELARRGIRAVIPSNASRKQPIPHDAELYKGRNRVERLVGKCKQFRAIATRYDKLDLTYLACVHLVAAFVKLR
jgi:transposase